MPKPVLQVPTVTNTGALVGRPRKNTPPSDAAQQITALAFDGWSIVGIAEKLGTTPPVLRRWMDENPSLRESFDLGREKERRTLHNKVFRTAVEGDDKNSLLAAMYLLNSRHGYRADAPEGARVNVAIITLPAERPLSDFIEIENADGSQTHSISRKRT
jgi:hypothetical protein